MADKPMVSSQSRVFLIDGGARADRSPVYKGFARMNGLSQDYGDIEPIYVPSQTQYGSFDDVGEVRGAKSRATTTLQSRYTLSALSDMLRLAEQGCSFDVHLHMGACTDPRQFNKFDKVIIFEDATATNYSTDDLGALASDENQVVNESTDLSGRRFYEVVPVQYGVKAASTITTEVMDVQVLDSVACGSCGDYSDGCYKIFAIMKGVDGSPLLKTRVVYSLDKGATWYATIIDSVTGDVIDATAVAKLGDNLVVISNAEIGLNYAPFDDFDGVTTPDFTMVTTGFTAAKFPMAMVSVEGVIYMVGVDGYIYKCEAAEDGVTLVDAGSASGGTVLNAVHGISSDELLAVGDNGVIIYTTDGAIWVAAAGAISFPTDDLVTCWMKSLTEWWVGSSQGRLYYTVNGGKTWTEKAFSGSGAGGIGAISFSTKNVGWMAHNNATPRARIFRTIDGGSSWYVTPEGNSTLPLGDTINALGVCSQDPNFVVAGGLADDAADGYLVVGTAV